MVEYYSVRYRLQERVYNNEEYNRYLKDLGLNYEDAKDKIIWIDDFESYI